jgi:hypothetical protein
VIRGIVEIISAHRTSRERWALEQTPLGQDRRVYNRVPFKDVCRMTNPMFGLEGQCKAVDISLGGMGLVGPINWPEGSHVLVQIESLGFDCEAVIVFRKEEPPQFRYSVKFQRLGFWQLIKLQRALSRLNSAHTS